MKANMTRNVRFTEIPQITHINRDENRANNESNNENIDNSNNENIVTNDNLTNIDILLRQKKSLLKHQRKSLECIDHSKVTQDPIGVNL